MFINYKYFKYFLNINKKTFNKNINSKQSIHFVQNLIELFAFYFNEEKSMFKHF